MICSNCQSPNDNENVFCVNCGATFSPTGNVSGDIPPTHIFQGQTPTLPPTQRYQSDMNSIETAVLPVGRQGFSSTRNFSGVVPPFLDEPQTKKRDKTLLLAGAALILLLAVGAGAFYLFNKQPLNAEVLPEHLGMFLQSKDKTKVEEVKKQDFTNALEGKDNLLKDDNLPVADGNPNLILYSDGKDVPLNDLKLVQLDTIKDDGSLKQLNFQAAPVEGKPEMKRIRVPDGLAEGKYAFALFDGYLNEGKHKLWAFQIKNAEKSNNDEALKSASVSVKPKTTDNSNQTSNQSLSQPTKPKVPPPPGGTVAYVTSGNVIFRSGPSQSSASMGKFYQGQKVYVIGYSSNYETFYSKRTNQSFYSNFAEVQSETGQRGWIYAIYIR